MCLFSRENLCGAAAAPDGGQMEENDRKGSGLRIYPVSSGKLQTQTTVVKQVKTPAGPALSCLFTAEPCLMQ